MWDEGCAKLSPKEMVALRDRVTGESLRATIGSAASEDAVVAVAEVLERAIDAVDGTGRPLFAALRAQPRLADPYGRLWRADRRRARAPRRLAHRRVRRGRSRPGADGHPVRGLGRLPGRRVQRHPGVAGGRGGAAVARLEADGLIADGKITPEGTAFRDAIEAATDTAQDDLLAAVGDDLDSVVEQTDAWSQRCVEGDAFPPDIRKRAAG